MQARGLLSLPLETATAGLLQKMDWEALASPSQMLPAAGFSGAADKGVSEDGGGITQEMLGA